MPKNDSLIIQELTKLEPKFFSGLDKAITSSKFWTQDNTDDSWLVRNSQPQTDAAKRLQDALRVFAKTNNTNIIFYVESPLDTESGRYTLGPEHPANSSDWLFNADFNVAEKSGRKKLTLDLMILSDEYDTSSLNVTRLIDHVASTIRHELIHYSQIKKQTSDRRGRSMLSTFRKMKQDPRQIPSDNSPKYKNMETGEWLSGGQERYYKDYLEAHIEVDAYAFEAAELLIKKFGKQGAIDILRRKINFDDPNLPTALTKYAPDLVGQEVQNALKKRIYTYITSIDTSGLLGELARYAHIDFIPPKGVASSASRGLRYRKMAGGAGGFTAKQASKHGIGSGVQRAVNLKNRNKMSPKTVRRMKAFFDRHEKNKKIDKGKRPYEDRGFVAWLLWGGDAGRRWAEKIVRQMNSIDQKTKNESRLREKKVQPRKKKLPGRPGYYVGKKTRKTKSNREMEREINKCLKEPRPKSCYDEWTADKTYKEKTKNVKKESYDILRELIRLSVVSEVAKKKKGKKSKSNKLGKTTRATLREKANKANMPLGALTSVYRKGLAAWLSGHIQGVGQHQWAMARVNSFIRGGKTRKVDVSEWNKVKKYRHSRKGKNK